MSKVAGDTTAGKWCRKWLRALTFDMYCSTRLPIIIIIIAQKELILRLVGWVLRVRYTGCEYAITVN